MCTLVTLLFAAFSVVGAHNFLGDSQAVAWTTTWPANPDSNPLAKLCFQTHVNLPVYTFTVAGMTAIGQTIWETGLPHSAHNTTCPGLGFKELAFDQKTCAADPDCKPIAVFLADVTVWGVDTETLGKIVAQSDVISIVRSLAPTLEEGHSASQTLDANSDVHSQGVAWTTTWPANPDSNPLAKLCFQTHVNLPIYTFLAAGMSAIGQTIWDTGYPHSAHNTTCPDLGFKELAFDRKTCTADPDCKPIAVFLDDVTVWGAHTETLGRIAAQPDVISIVQQLVPRHQEAHSYSQPSKTVADVMV